MPWTPAHIGPVILIGALAGKKLNLTILITVTIIIDLEVLILGIIKGDFIYHGFFHTFEGATILGLIYGAIFFKIRNGLWKKEERYSSEIDAFQKLNEWRKHNWMFSYKCSIISAIIGAYSHISLDWLLYEDIRISVFSNTNIYYDFTSKHFVPTISIIYLFCLFSFIIGLLLYMYRFKSEKNKSYKVSNIYDLRLHRNDISTIIGIISTPFAIAGVLIFILIRTSNYPLLLLSGGSILTMIIGYIISLENANWKLIE